MTQATDASTSTSPPRYDIARTYQWNYDHAPDGGAAAGVEPPHVPGAWRFCGIDAPSPLGIAAGPLLNGRWIEYYAALGFDVLTYKTVRSGFRACYDLPNLAPVRARELRGDEEHVSAGDRMEGSWAISFGMPSMTPEIWRADVRRTRQALPAQKLLSVSVVGTVQPGWGLDELAADYAQCARWAAEAGADAVETNFSCPNVCTRDGQLYQQPADAAIVPRAVRQAIGSRAAYLVKIGHVRDEPTAAALVDGLGPHVDALAMVNSVTSKIRGPDGRMMFDGQMRGIGGDACRCVAVEQVRMFRRLIDQSRRDTKIIGVGGISTAEHVSQFLDAGAEAVHLATAVMTDPLVGVKIRRALAKG